MNGDDSGGRERMVHNHGYDNKNNNCVSFDGEEGKNVPGNYSEYKKIRRSQESFGRKGIESGRE